MKHLILLSALCSLSAVAATQLYRSVDAQGNVSFSDQPPASGKAATVDVSTRDMNILPSEGVEAEIQRQKQVDQEAAQQRAVDQREWQARYQQAEDELAAAQQALAEAQEIKEGDTVGSAFGGARPSEAWILRLEQAEADVDARRRALQQLKRER